jgi:hypothetical protein
VDAGIPLCTMLNADTVVLDLIVASLVAAAIPLRTMLSADSIVYNLVSASIMAAANPLRTMLKTYTIVFDNIVTSLLDAEKLYPLQEHIHIINHQYTVHFQHHFTEISMPKICIKTNNMFYFHSIWNSNSVSKSNQTLLI